jgi:hypothetical protein
MQGFHNGHVLCLDEMGAGLDWGSTAKQEKTKTTSQQPHAVKVAILPRLASCGSIQLSQHMARSFGTHVPLL